MKRITLIILLIAILASCQKEISYNLQPTKPRKEDTSSMPVVFLMGQSDMQGGDKNTSATSAEFKGVFEKIKVYFKPDKNVPGTIQNIEYGVNNNFTNQFRYFGPECPLAYYMTLSGKKICIVKYARGGSALVDTKFHADGHWQVDADPKNGEAHYPVLLNNHAKIAFQQLRALGYHPYTLAIAWGQGHADTHDSIAVPRYEYELTRLFDTFKIDFKSTDSTVGKAMAIVVRTHNLPASFTYQKEIRSAQSNFALNYPNAYLINSDSWPLTRDSVHFTRIGQGLQGKAIHDVLIGKL